MSVHEFLIIGGGVIGLSIARALRRRGAGGVAVIDRGRVGCEASWAAGGMLAPNAETHEDGVFFRFCTASNALYPDFAAQLVEETGIDVELDRSGTLFISFDDGEAREAAEKYRWQKAAGIEVAQLGPEELKKLEPDISPRAKTGLYYPNDWQVENRKLVAALRRSCELLGVKIFEGVEAAEILTGPGRSVGVRTSDGEEITAAKIIVANGAWASGLFGTEVVKPIRGQMICFGGSPRALNSVIYSPRGYVIPRADGRVLAGATVEDVGFSKQVRAEAVVSMREAALEISPVLANFYIKESWAGLRPFAADGLPVIGPVPGREGVFVATGHYRNGILLAPQTAETVAGALLDGENSEYLEAFDPARLSASADAAVSNRL